MKRIFSLYFVAFSFAFTSLYGGWGNPIDVYNAPLVFTPAVGIDLQGNAVVLSTYSTDSFTYLPRAAQIINNVPTNLYDFPLSASAVVSHSLFVNSGGNALAGWLEQETNAFVSASVLINNVWSAPEIVSDENNFFVDCFCPTGTHLDDFNRGLTMWSSIDTAPNNYCIQSSSYNAIWQPPQDISASPNVLTDPAMAGSPSGQAFVVWLNFSPDGIYGSYYNGNTWGSGVPVSTDIRNTNIPPSAVAMNASNIGVVAWSSTAGVSAARLSNGVFETPQLVAPTGGDPLEYAAAIDVNGNAFVGWVEDDTVGGVIILKVSRYVNGVWDAPIILDSFLYTDPFINITNFDIAVDGQGNAYAIWEKTDVSSNGAIYYNQYSSDSGSWGASTLLSLPGISTFEADLSVNSFGRAIVAWLIENAGSSFTLQVIISNNSLPPQSFTGQQIVNKFIMGKEYVNVLFWTPSPDQNVTSYYLFRNGTQIATISANGPFTYQDYTGKKSLPYTYSLTAFSPAGGQSQALTVTLP